MNSASYEYWEQVGQSYRHLMTLIANNAFNSKVLIEEMQRLGEILENQPEETMSAHIKTEHSHLGGSGPDS